MRDKEALSITFVCSCATKARDREEPNSTVDRSNPREETSNGKTKRFNKEPCKFRLKFNYSIETRGYCLTKIVNHNHPPMEKVIYYTIFINYFT